MGSVASRFGGGRALAEISRPQISNLSYRELEVLELLQDNPPKDVAAILGVSVFTVYGAINRIRQKIGFEVSWARSHSRRRAVFPDWYFSLLDRLISGETVGGAARVMGHSERSANMALSTMRAVFRLRSTLSLCAFYARMKERGTFPAMPASE